MEMARWRTHFAVHTNASRFRWKRGSFPIAALFVGSKSFIHFIFSCAISLNAHEKMCIFHVHLNAAFSLNVFFLFFFFCLKGRWRRKRRGRKGRIERNKLQSINGWGKERVCPWTLLSASSWFPSCGCTGFWCQPLRSRPSVLLSTSRKTQRLMNPYCSILFPGTPIPPQVLRSPSGSS